MSRLQPIARRDVKLSNWQAFSIVGVLKQDGINRVFADFSPRGTKGFVVLLRRWVVERTFAWLGRYRRMSRDFEVLPATSEAMIYVAMIDLMSRRLAAL